MFRIILLRVLNISGINALFRIRNRNKVAILIYHGICDDGYYVTENHLPKSVFRKQLSYLKSKGYVFINMSQLMSVLEKRGEINKFVVLTFDDGFRNVVHNAYPIMVEFGAKGCFYIVSDLIGTNHLLWGDYVETLIRNQKKEDFQFIFNGNRINYRIDTEQLRKNTIEDIKNKLKSISDKERYEHLKQFNNMRLDDFPKDFAMASWEEINNLDPEILEIGCHTKRHPSCANLTLDEEMDDEILNSKDDIERHIGRKIEQFCYPEGSYNERVIERLKQCGYKSAVTINYGFNDEMSDHYKLNRIEHSRSNLMSEGDQLLLFEAIVSGCWGTLSKTKKRFSRILIR